MARGGAVEIREFWSNVFTSLGVSVITGISDDDELFSMFPVRYIYSPQRPMRTMEEGREDVRKILDANNTNCIFNPQILTASDDFSIIMFRCYIKSKY